MYPWWYRVPVLWEFPPRRLYSVWKRKLPGIRRKEAKMFQDALFVPERHLRDKAAALPLAALVHAVALALLVTVPLLRVGELPEVDVSGVIVVPALPATPLPPPKARSGQPRRPHRQEAGHRGRPPRPGGSRPSTSPSASSRRASLGPKAPSSASTAASITGWRAGLPANLLGDALYGLVGDAESAVIRAVGEVRPPKLVRRVEPDYPEIARQARVAGRRHPRGDDRHLRPGHRRPGPAVRPAPRRGRRRRPSGNGSTSRS